MTTHTTLLTRPSLYILCTCTGATLILSAGCASSPEALHRVDSLVTTATNAVALIQPIVTTTTGPYGPIVALGMSGITAALVAWQSYLHNRASVAQTAHLAAASRPANDKP